MNFVKSGMIVAFIIGVVAGAAFIGTPLLRSTQGSSMEPVLFPGDVVVCLPTMNYEEGDIVVFKPGVAGLGNDVELVVHKVVRESGNYVRTKGVANRALDPEIVRKKDIICEVVWHT